MAPKTAKTRGKIAFGGGVRRTIDVQRLAAAIRGPGVDTRFWCSSGTVGTVDKDGNFDPTNPKAVYADTESVIVDVRLEPSEIPLSCRFHGISLGRLGRILIPIFPGDEVMCFFPDGNLNHASRAAVLWGGNAFSGVPSDWMNDRVLFELAEAAIQIKAPAISLESENLRLNGRAVLPSPDPI